MGYDPYREEVRRVLLPLVVGVALIAGYVSYALVRPHVAPAAAVAVGVSVGLVVEVVIVLLFKPRRGR